MANAIDETGLVVSLLVQHAVEIRVDLINALPVGDVLLQMVEHIDALDVGTSMQGTFQ